MAGACVEVEGDSKIEAIARENLFPLAPHVPEVTRSTDYSKETALLTLGHNRSVARDVIHLGYIAAAVRKNPAPTLERSGSTARVSFNVERTDTTAQIVLREGGFVHIDVENDRFIIIAGLSKNGETKHCYRRHANDNPQ